MQELEKILKEIDHEVEEYMEIDFGDEYNCGIKDMAKMAKKIIRKHMNDGWIQVEERLPDKKPDGHAARQFVHKAYQNYSVRDGDTDDGS